MRPITEGLRRSHDACDQCCALMHEIQLHGDRCESLDAVHFGASRLSTNSAVLSLPGLVHILAGSSPLLRMAPDGPDGHPPSPPPARHPHLGDGNPGGRPAPEHAAAAQSRWTGHGGYPWTPSLPPESKSSRITRITPRLRAIIRDAGRSRLELVTTTPRRLLLTRSDPGPCRWLFQICSIRWSAPCLSSQRASLTTTCSPRTRSGVMAPFSREPRRGGVGSHQRAVPPVLGGPR